MSRERNIKRMARGDFAGRDAQRDRRDACPTHVGRLAFTLIELLAVIAIIGLLSALVLGLSGVATTKSRESRMKSEQYKVLTGIESYKAELGNYPPDNQETNTWRNDDYVGYRTRAGRNPLFYELSGAIFSSGSFTVAARNETVTAVALKAELGVNGIENSSRNQREIPFKGIPFKQSQYQELKTAAGTDVEVLAAPLKGPVELDGKLGKINPFFYDASSTNRHNPDGVDLWVEYLHGKQTNVFGNWKE